MRPRPSFGLAWLLAAGAWWPRPALADVPQPALKPARPNVVVILADDLGFADLGCYGSEIHTPNLDRLAEQGVRFTQFYNCGRCCPTRAALLTGLYAHQAGVGHMIEDGGSPAYHGELNDRCVTLAEALKAADYHTDMVGKWHLAHVRVTGKDQVNHRNADPFWLDRDDWPLQRGFDSFFGTIIGVGDYFDPFTLTDGNDPVEKAPPHGFYYTDAITDHAVARIADDAKGPRPFFLYVAFTAPHWPLHAPPEDVEKYKDAYQIGWDELRTRRRARQVELKVIDPKWELPPREPESREWDKAPDHEWEAHRMAVYAAQVDRLDQGVGRILKALDDAKVADDTLVLFLSDNGACQENVEAGWFDVTTATRDGRPVRIGNKPGREAEAMPGPEEIYQSYGPGWANASNTPFRRYKHFAHEGGIATPLIARWPAAIRRPGAIVREPGHVIDLMPTLLELAGGAYPATYHDRPVTPAEGSSLAAALLGRPHEARGPLFWEHEGNRAVRVGDWKLVAENGRPWELYDMAADRTETHDLAAEQPDRVKELTATYRRWADRVGVRPWP